MAPAPAALCPPLRSEVVGKHRPQLSPALILAIPQKWALPGVPAGGGVAAEGDQVGAGGLLA